jgi:hypothetical protein
MQTRSTANGKIRREIQKSSNVQNRPGPESYCQAIYFKMSKILGDDYQSQVARNKQGRPRVTFYVITRVCTSKFCFVVVVLLVLLLLGETLVRILHY